MKNVTRWVLAGGICLSCGLGGLGMAQGDDVAEDVAELVGGNSRFAFDLYGTLREEEGNLFFAPHSLSVALAMAYAGAAGETERQMARALRFDLAQDRLHPAFAALDTALAARGEGARGQDGAGFRLRVANALWGQRGYDLLPAFLDTLSEHYGSSLHEVDFVGAPEEARLEINSWTSERTEGRIEDLLPEGAVNPLTRLVLTNAVYFNAAWQHPFDEASTEDAPFTLLDGSEVMAPTMRGTEHYPYAEGDGFQVLELPYDGGELSMVVFLPEAGTFEAFEAALEVGTVEEALGNLTLRELRLFMPRFSYRSSFSLAGTLHELGMRDAFTPGAADFSGMTGTRELFIDEVVHEAFVLVDEEGTEAAAATGLVMRVTAVAPEPLEVRLDRPFVYLIRDVETGALLFMGRLLNPLE